MKRSVRCVGCGLPMGSTSNQVGRAVACPPTGRKQFLGRRTPRRFNLQIPLLVVAGIAVTASVALAATHVLSKPSPPARQTTEAKWVSKPLISPERPAATVAEAIPEPLPEVVPVPEPVAVTVEVAPEPRRLLPPLATRLDDRSSQELETLLRDVREISLDEGSAQKVSKSLISQAKTQWKTRKPFFGSMTLSKSRPELAGMPFLCGPDSKISATAATNMDSLARRYRQYFGTKPTDKDISQADHLYASLRGAFIPDGTRESPWASSEAVPCIRQMIQPDSREMRAMACALLSEIKDPEATAALVQWAVFDTDARNREDAVKALLERDRVEVAKLLAPHLRYPFAPVVEHACEAIAALKLEQSIPDLLAAKDQPDPDAPYETELPFGMGGTFRREVVRVNHARNCVMCHTPSLDEKEALRAAIPDPTRALPPPNSQAYYGSPGEQIAASTTYLRQYFSLMQPVANPGPWP